MKPHWQRWTWRSVKVLLALLVLLFVGRQFYRDLGELDWEELPWQPGWLLACGGLYLAGLFASVLFWRHLLNLFGYPVSLYAAVRACYIGQLGKYVPGKWLAVLIRAGLVHPQGVPYGVSIIATFYEVFTGMASGAIVAALVFIVEPPDIIGDDLPSVAGLQWHPAWLGVALIGLCGIPLLPGLFNFIIGRLAAKIQVIELYRLPPVRFGTLAAGLLSTAVGWWLQGLSCWAMLQAILPEPPDFTFANLALCTSSIAIANVAGFVVVFLPAGLGVREILLKLLLSSLGPVKYIAWTVILLRLTSIAAEAIFAAILWLPINPKREN